MQHKSFLLSDFLSDNSEPGNENPFDFLTQQGKLFIFYEHTLIKQGMFKNKYMTYTLCHWLERDTKLISLAKKEADRVVICAIYDVDEVVQTKVDSLRKILRDKGDDMQYEYPNTYHEDEYPVEDYSSDFNVIVYIPLEPDETVARIKYVNALLSDHIAVNMLTDKDIGFLTDACATVNLSIRQKSYFNAIQNKLNRIRAARV